MDVRLIEKSKDKDFVIFSLKGADAPFANMLRRYMIEEVPVMAVEDVELRKNSSVLYDEVVAHRLGLVPLTTDLKSYNVPAKCKCDGKGCAQCQLKLIIRAKGPGMVYSAEIKSKDPKVKPVFQKIPVTKLLKGQLLEAEMTAVMGRGKEHGKWSPGHVYYRNKPVIEITGEPDNARMFAERYPGVFEMKGTKLAVNKDNLVKYDYYDDFESMAKGKVKFSEVEDEFIFYIESYGQLDYIEMLTQALSEFEMHLEEFIGKIKEA